MTAAAPAETGSPTPADMITEAKSQAYRACAEEIAGVLDVEIPAELPPDGEGWDWLITQLRGVLGEVEDWITERDVTCDSLAEVDQWAQSVLSERLIDPIADWAEEHGADDPNMEDPLGLRLGAVWGALHAAERERDAVRTELSQVQRERDEARLAHAGRAATVDSLVEQIHRLAAHHGVESNDDPADIVDVAIRDLAEARTVAGSRIRERDEARSALAALRAEVKIIRGYLANVFPDLDGRQLADLCRVWGERLDAALVTDQSPAAPAVCRCPTNEVGDIRCHNCGERVNKRCWKCDTPRGDGPCPTAGLSPTSDTQTSDGSES